MLKNLGQCCQCKGRSDFLKGKVISSFFHAFHGNVRIKSCELFKFADLILIVFLGRYLFFKTSLKISHFSKKILFLMGSIAAAKFGIILFSCGTFSSSGILKSGPHSEDLNFSRYFDRMR